MFANSVGVPKRILIVNPFGIGDVLFTTPLVRAIHRAFPKSRIGYLCNRRTERVLRDNPHLDALFVYEKDDFVDLCRTSRWAGLRYLAKLFQQINHFHCDWVMDLSLGERYSFLTALMGAKRRVGFNFRGRGRFLTESYPIEGYQDDHVAEHYRRLLKFLGIEMIDSTLEFPVSNKDECWVDDWLAKHGLASGELLVGIVPAGGVSWGINASFRRWSFEGFAKVADALVERYGARVLLFGESADRDACASVSRLMRNKAVDVSGQTNLGQFVSFLGRLGLVVCNDGGPLHLAVSQKVRTVSIFGPVDPAVYGPYGPDNHAAHQTVFREELLCRPCYNRFRLPPCPYERACLTAVTAEDVLEGCVRILEKPALVRQ